MVIVVTFIKPSLEQFGNCARIIPYSNLDNNKIQLFNLNCYFTTLSYPNNALKFTFFQNSLCSVFKNKDVAEGSNWISHLISRLGSQYFFRNQSSKCIVKIFFRFIKKILWGYFWENFGSSNFYKWHISVIYALITYTVLIEAINSYLIQINLQSNNVSVCCV